MKYSICRDMALFGPLLTGDWCEWKLLISFSVGCRLCPRELNMMVYRGSHAPFWVAAHSITNSFSKISWALYL